MQTAIQHNEMMHRFEWSVDGSVCVLEYALDGSTMTITHTGVPAALGGRGLAADLMKTAFDTARSRGWKVVPACSYAAAWVIKHPDYNDVVA